MENLKYIFRRKIYAKLLEWKKRENGASALLVEGARRIGKSIITEQFAKNEYESYLKIDFSNASTRKVPYFSEIPSPYNYISG